MINSIISKAEEAHALEFDGTLQLAQRPWAGARQTVQEKIAPLLNRSRRMSAPMRRAQVANVMQLIGRYQIR